MTIHQNTLRMLAASVFALGLSTQFAAADTAAFAERFKTVMTENGAVVNWSSMSGDGESELVLKDVTVSSPGTPGSANIGTVTLTDISEDEGEYTIGELTVEPSSFENEGVKVDLGTIVFSGMILPAPDETGPLAGIVYYDSASIDTVAAHADGKQVFTLSNMSFEIDYPDENSPMSFTGSAESFSADLSGLEDPKAKMAAEALGFTQINGDMEIAGYWNPADGRAALEQYDFTIENAGTIGFTFDFGGYTPELIKSLREIQAKMANASEQEQQAQGMAVLGLMQQMTLVGASVRFDDDTLTQKVLAFVAAQQGQKPQDIANQAKALLPFMMMQLNNPELTQAVSEAVNKFLDNPESLEIAVEPENPIPFAMIAASAMTAPEALPQQLRLRVRANQ